MTKSQIDIAIKILENTHKLDVYDYELVIDGMLNRKKVLRLIHDGQMTVLHKGSYAECITTAKDFLMLLN